MGPTKPSMHYEPAGLGYTLSDGPAPFAFDGDQLLEVRDGILIRRDAALAELSRIPLADVTSFAVLSDRSLVVRVHPAAQSPRLHHVVANKSVASYDLSGKLLAATEMATEVWQVDDRIVARGRFGTGKAAGILVPTAGYEVPEGTLPGFAALADGSIVVSSPTAILHADASNLNRHDWTGSSRHLGPGPEPRMVWATHQLDKIALVELKRSTATAVALHPVRTEEAIVHLAGADAHAAAVVARAVPATGIAEVSLAMYDARGERWRVPLDSERAIFYVALSATRVVVRSQPAYTLRAWDLATGKPA